MTLSPRIRTLLRAALGGAGLAAGFGLSFLAFGLMWIGVPLAYQFAMVLPFCLVAFVISRLGAPTFPVLLGMLPLGALITQFRDPSGSQASSIALVLAWVLAVLLGQRLGSGARVKGHRSTSG
jgi:threonine/homoserine efflux transporter RhtA